MNVPAVIRGSYELEEAMSDFLKRIINLESIVKDLSTIVTSLRMDYQSNVDDRWKKWKNSNYQCLLVEGHGEEHLLPCNNSFKHSEHYEKYGKGSDGWYIQCGGHSYDRT